MTDRFPANLVFITESNYAYEALANMLVGSELEATNTRVNEINQLKKIHDQGTDIDIIFYWHKQSAIKGDELKKTVETFRTPPSIVLITDLLSPQDYIAATQLGASDVVDTRIPAQFSFVVAREFSNIQLHRRLYNAVKEYREHNIVDESALDPNEVTISGMGGMVETIDDALKNNRFELLFQPIMAVEDDNYDNFEIFLRIKEEGGNYIMPSEFLHVAEQFGLMPAIDRWVVQNAIKRFKAEEQVRKIKKQTSRALRFFLNISGHSLVDEVIMGNIIVEIVGAKLNPGSFVIEVDKNTILSRLQKTKSLNQNVKKLKLGFAIDYYEESDNSLNYVKHVAVDYLKLSQTVVQNIHKTPEKRDAVREIVKKARENNILVVATQVENAEVLPTLYDLNVDYIQGYVIAEPGPRLSSAIMDTTLG